LPKISFGSRSIELPRSRAARISLGVVLVLAGGLGGWLPILGFWMVPLGLVILSVDIPSVRRWRRKTTVAIVGWWRGRKEKGSARSAAGRASAKPPLRDTSLVP
jgi:hypothetical protein